MSLRWWILDFEMENYFPTKEGVTIPYTTPCISNLLAATVLLLSEGNQLDTIIENIKSLDYIKPVKLNKNPT
jgi:hypothetical protein